mmetsp:Transcript_13870/g.31815  ORF Transcript_13870/g.31815 Transcript_13870/m.31815 type:complete len:501 (+) Transcript_13870:101-1603(+)
MKICGACAKSLPKEDYSGKQWKLNQHARRCKWCIAESCPLRAAAVQAVQAAEPVARHDGPPCWICLDCGPSPDGELPRRDCSCRGETSGFAHTQCLKEYADKKTFHYISVVLARTRACVDFDKWKEPYTVCPNCHQSYENDVALDMSDGLIEFVEREYKNRVPQITYWRTNMLVAKGEKMSLYGVMSFRKPEQAEDAKDLAEEIFCLIRELREMNFYGMREQSVVNSEIACLVNLAQVYRARGDSHEGIQKSIQLFQTARDISLRFNEDLSFIEHQLNHTIGLLTGGRPSEEHIAMLRVQYEDKITNLGEENRDALVAGKRLAKTLDCAGHAIEAMKIFQRNAAISRRVLGAHHEITISLEKGLSERFVLAPIPSGMAGNGGMTWALYQAIRYEPPRASNDAEELVVKGPILSPRDSSVESEMNVPWIFIRLPTNHNGSTPVRCRGLRKAAHLNGKIGDVRGFNESTERYRVHFHDGSLRPVEAKISNLEILFELPDDFE